MGSGTFRFRRLNRLEKDICISLDFYLDACEVLEDIDCFSGPQNDLRYKPNVSTPFHKRFLNSKWADKVWAH
ncbi:hypothetical protein QJS10_CPB17g02528 [Acorus calamus]|uniref:Uncharacterized protein n=1 Tax=Acorus calamus TaxID=4465 RepID=A0AAV9CR14_ACOCL|nr:hypothetical protein QJS10_CPB17g02528 [Acorus calamus]